jgi:TrmH family RNA methyltransferase
MQITSADNPLVRRLRRLAESPRASRTAGRSIAEGIHLVECAVAAGVAIETIVVSERASESARELARRITAQGDCRHVSLAVALFDAISPVEHGAGILAEIVIESSELPVATVADAIYLDGLQDPGNVGALLRTAAAAGVKHVAAAPGTAFLWAPKVLRAAMGAHFALKLYNDVSPEKLAVAFVGERLSADAHAADSIYLTDWGMQPTVWLFGSEGQGLSAAAGAVAQRRLRIPVDASVESLNVAAAAAVCLFEQVRRRAPTCN